jgi:hypothetical protein
VLFVLERVMLYSQPSNFREWSEAEGVTRKEKECRGRVETRHHSMKRSSSDVGGMRKQAKELSPRQTRPAIIPAYGRTVCTCTVPIFQIIDVDRPWGDARLHSIRAYPPFQRYSHVSSFESIRILEY